VLNNGIDSNRFNKDNFKTEEKIRIRCNLNIKKEDFVVLFSGRLIKEKGVLELVKAFKLLKKIKNIKLVIVGSSWYGKNEKNDFINEIEKESMKIKEKIIFTGYIDYNEINKIYSIGDVISLPSMWDDPFPLTVLEAMSMGIPVITTFSGGIPEMFGENEGILLKRDENIVDNLAQSIEYLYCNPEIRDNIGKNARIKVNNRFTNNKFYNKFIEILNEKN
uniref:glycosyltransferase family 4 protein n=1 Tax=Clostridium baratii TaxID=1561 RepID=UPI00374FCD6E